ncbi:MAG: sugar transferase [Acidobacteria bacterium]|nr:MAG: sugar transferase [Acidobacteriota bacterium]
MSQVVQAADILRYGARTMERHRSLDSLLVMGLILWDGIIAISSFILAYWIHLGPPLFIWEKGHWLPVGIAPDFRPVWILLGFVPFVRMSTLWYCRLYRVQGEFAFSQDLARIVKAVSLGSAIMILIAFMYRGGFEFRHHSYSRMMFILDWTFALQGTLILRMTVRLIQIAARKRGKNIIPAVVIGEGQLAELCLREIMGNHRLGYELVGVLTRSPRSEHSSNSRLPVIGTIADLPALIRQCGIREVLIADDQLDQQVLFETIMKCGRTHPVHYHVIPNLLNCLPQKTEIDQIGILPMVKLFEEPLRGFNRYVKRTMDVIGASLLLLLTSPLWLILAILIKWESPGPVLYKQERVGMDGHVFLMYKFRSMRPDADDRRHREIMKRLIRGERINNGTPDKPIYGKVKDDDRITRVGRWMRRYSLDELPQLLNVLRGEMSLVGPRPPIPYEVECYQPWHRARFHVKPGLTGLWQVSGRNRLPFDEMVRLDIFYIENWSLWMDLKIMLKTPTVMLAGCTE